MTSRSKLIFIPAFLVAALAISIVLFYNFAEELRIHVLQPAVEAYFVLRYYLSFVPQLLLWMIPLLFVSLIMIRRSSLRRSQPDRPKQPRRTQAIAPGRGELAQLARQIRRAHHSRFARVRISRMLVEIGARQIATHEGTSLWRARQQLAAGYWRNAGNVHHFLTPRRHYTARQSGPDFKRSLQETVRHLEEFDRTIGSFEKPENGDLC